MTRVKPPLEDDPSCLHCAIWRAIMTHLGDKDTSSVLTALAHCVGDLISNSPERERPALAFAFCAGLGAVVKQRDTQAYG